MENPVDPPDGEDPTNGTTTRIKISSILIAKEPNYAITGLKVDGSDESHLLIQPTRLCTVINKAGQFWDILLSEFICADEERCKKLIEQAWEQPNWFENFKKREITQ